ncbi:hypothetical protein ACFY3K_00620 [Staphylococcus capitis]|uniref:hypothetical protein n=1 Tax=Staphylococcus capitis TaxID=29388 RepID=UPI0036D1C119
MEKYGWTLTEVKNQPYFELLSILNHDENNQNQQKQQPHKPKDNYYTGSDLRLLFGG